MLQLVPGFLVLDESVYVRVFSRLSIVSLMNIQLSVFTGR